MLLLNRPYCGATAEETDPRAGGEAHLKRFGPGSSDNNFSLTRLSSQGVLTRLAQQILRRFDPAHLCAQSHGVLNRFAAFEQAEETWFIQCENR